jgi:hypothetical protein
VFSRLNVFMLQTAPVVSDAAVFALTVVLVILTVVLVWVGIDTSRKLGQVNRVTERFFHLGILFAGSFLEETVHIPTDWVRADHDSLVTNLSEIDGIQVELLHGEIAITYRLNQESETLQALLKDCREPEKIREKVSLYSRL